MQATWIAVAVRPDSIEHPGRGESRFFRNGPWDVLSVQNPPPKTKKKSLQREDSNFCLVKSGTTLWFSTASPDPYGVSIAACAEYPHKGGSVLKVLGTKSYDHRN